MRYGCPIQASSYLGQLVWHLMVRPCFFKSSTNSSSAGVCLAQSFHWHILRQIWCHCWSMWLWGMDLWASIPWIWCSSGFWQTCSTTGKLPVLNHDTMPWQGGGICHYLPPFWKVNVNIFLALSCKETVSTSTMMASISHTIIARRRVWLVISFITGA